MTGHDDFAFEPIPGLPERPPAGEEILWQGQPSVWALAREAYKLYWIAAYFVILVLWRASNAFTIGGLGTAIAVAIPHMLLGVVVCAIVVLLAYMQARATMYTITSARVVMRIGAALSVTFNLPYSQIGNATLDLRKSGTGTIALETLGSTKISYLVAWPNARPYRFTKTEPALRCIPDAARLARLLGNAAEQRMNVPMVTRKEAGLASSGAKPVQEGILQ